MRKRLLYGTFHVNVLVVCDGDLNYSDDNVDGLSSMLKLVYNNYQHAAGFEICFYLAHRDELETESSMSVVHIGGREHSVVHGFDFTKLGEKRFGSRDGCGMGRKQEQLHWYDQLGLEDFGVLMLFGFHGPASSLKADERTLIHTAMDQGLGVFAAGDHGKIGAGLCGDLKRIRFMQKWHDSLPDTLRFSKNSIMPSPIEPFQGSENDDLAAMISKLSYHCYHYPSPVERKAKRTEFYEAKHVHPLFCDENGSEVSFLPDHPHEGEVEIPWSHQRYQDVLAKEPARAEAFVQDFGEMGPDQLPLLWEIVASLPNRRLVGPWGDYLPSGNLEQVMFGAVGAYNGHLHQNPRGRIVVDSSFHHWVNGNLTGIPYEAGISVSDRKERRALRGTPALEQIQRYFCNVIQWLIPRSQKRDMYLSILANSLEDGYLENYIALQNMPEWQIGRATIRILSTFYGSNFIACSWKHFSQLKGFDERILAVDQRWLERCDEIVVGHIMRELLVYRTNMSLYGTTDYPPFSCDGLASRFDEWVKEIVASFQGELEKHFKSQVNLLSSF